MSNRKTQKAAARAARLAREAEIAARARRRLQLTISAGGALAFGAVIVVGILLLGPAGTSSKAVRGLSATGSPQELRTASAAPLGRMRAASAPGSLGPEGIPLPNAPALAGTKHSASGNQVDGIGCLSQEQVLFHIHAHLTVFVHGAARSIPYGIGITRPHVQDSPAGAFVDGGACFYFLHTHAADGIIHIESPVRRTYTLGDFFDIWGQQLSRRRVGPAAGPVTAFYDGRLYVGNPRDIPLHRHAQIQLDVGRPLVAPVRLRYWAQL
jgi:hypothetical protein